MHKKNNKKLYFQKINKNFLFGIKIFLLSTKDVIWLGSYNKKKKRTTTYYDDMIISGIRTLCNNLLLFLILKLIFGKKLRVVEVIKK